MDKRGMLLIRREMGERIDLEIEGEIITIIVAEIKNRAVLLGVKATKEKVKITRVDKDVELLKSKALKADDHAARRIVSGLAKVPSIKPSDALTMGRYQYKSIKKVPKWYMEACLDDESFIAKDKELIIVEIKRRKKHIEKENSNEVL